MQYPIILTPAEEGGFIVTSPDIDIVTEGDTLEDALAMASDAIDELLAHCIAQGEDIPLPHSKSKLYARPSPRVALRAQIYAEMRKQGVTPVELAKRLGWKHPQAYRLFNPNRKTDIGQFQQAAAALGKHWEMVLH